MEILYHIIIFFSLIQIIYNQVLQGECGEVGYKAKDYKSCEGKKPYDESSEYCCYIKAGKIQQCVEVLKADIDNNAIDLTIIDIEKGMYYFWEDNNGFNLNRDYDGLSELKCDKNFFLSIKIVLVIFFIFNYINI